MHLKGKIALITGGTRGIGKAIALKLASHGADVAVNFFSNRTGAENTVAELEKLGVQAIAVRGNAGNPDHMKKIFQKVGETYGALDIFVSNAAMGIFKSAMELEEKDWQRVMDINARALLHGAQEAVPLMEGRNDCRIISMTSLGSTRVLPHYVSIGPAKAALESLTRYLAAELAHKGIIVNAISAGVVDTDALKRFPNRDEILQDALRRTPVGRVGLPEDIANAVAMLCTADSNWICGQTIVVDGGFSLTA